MATVLTHPLGYKVRVTCDDVPMKIYGARHDDRTATCWIISEAGKHFEVHVAATQLRDAVSCYAFVDGVEVGGRVLEDGYRTSGTFRGQRVGPSSVKRMYFASFAVSDLEDQVTPLNVQELGTIRVEFRRVQVRGTMESKIRHAGLPDVRNGSVIVHEKAKKLGGHNTLWVNLFHAAARTVVLLNDPHRSLGEEVAINPPQTVGIEELDKEPYVTFVFRYRPHDVLRAQGLFGPENETPQRQTGKRLASESDAGQPSSTIASPPKRVKAEGIEEESIESLKARIRDLEALLPERERRVKEEHINASQYFIPGEVIDLTAEDSN